jgi:hypothetical protein
MTEQKEVYIIISEGDWSDCELEHAFTYESSKQAERVFREATPPVDGRLVYIRGVILGMREGEG